MAWRVHVSRKGWSLALQSVNRRVDSTQGLSLHIYMLERSSSWNWIDESYMNKGWFPYYNVLFYLYLFRYSRQEIHNRVASFRTLLLRQPYNPTTTLKETHFNGLQERWVTYKFIILLRPESISFIWGVFLILFSFWLNFEFHSCQSLLNLERSSDDWSQL